MSEPDFVRATRASYDAVAASYADWVRDELEFRPLDRALLAAFAELVRAASAGPVADIGCGPGRVTRYLAGLGVPAFGVDLSPQMIEVARRDHPDLRFEVGSMLALDLPGGSAGGVLAWYSTIHVPDEQLPQACAELARVLVPGGYLLAGFQAGTGTTHRVQARGQQIDLDFRRRQPEEVAARLEHAGLTIRATLVREPDDDWPGNPERHPQGFVLARKAEPRRQK